MKLEDQVCSLELSKRLKELGVKQESLFVWRKYQGWLCELKSNDFIEHGWNGNELHETAAFTVAELGELLKMPNQSISSFHQNCSVWTGDSWAIYDRGVVIVEEKTEADARAKMLIYLLENNFIKET